MENIYEPNNDFDFSQLSLAQPTGIHGGAYFTKFLYQNNPLYIETPKSLTKAGFIKNGKKIYTELMFDNNDNEFITWIENLETTCYNLIYANSDTWFKDKLELADIESAFTSSLRIYKSGKFYLIRVNGKINTLTGSPNIKIYNENETLLSVEDILPETNIISIVELQGIKFTNKSFQIDYEVKQIMILTIDKIFENCLIKKGKKRKEVLEEPKYEKDEHLEETLKEHLEEKEEEEHLEKTKDEKEDHLEEKEEEEEEDHLEENNIKITILEETDPNDLEEIDINNLVEDLNDEKITLNNPNDIYYKKYEEVKTKARTAKTETIRLLLEAKQLKELYMLEDSDSDDSYLDFDEL
jgi:hypothetical protein